MTAPVAQSGPPTIDATWGQVRPGNVVVVPNPEGHNSYWSIAPESVPSRLVMNLLDPASGQPVAGHAASTGAPAPESPVKIVASTVQAGQHVGPTAPTPAAPAQPAAAPAGFGAPAPTAPAAAPATMGEAVGNVQAGFPGASVVTSQDTPGTPVVQRDQVAELRAALAAAGRILVSLGGQG